MCASNTTLYEFQVLANSSQRAIEHTVWSKEACLVEECDREENRAHSVPSKFQKLPLNHPVYLTNLKTASHSF